MPGFEDAPEFLLKSHSLTDLLSVDQWETIDAIPRIQERAGVGPSDSLAALEHDHLRAVMVGDGDSRGRKLDVANWWNTYAHLSGELQRKQRFRNDPQGRVAYGLLIDDEDDEAQFTRFEYDGKRTAVSNLLHPLPFECAKGVEVWGVMDYLRQVEQLAEEMGISTSECALRFGALELPEKGCDQGWDYHPALGFSRHQ